MSFICLLYRFLFRIIPIPGWQAFIMDRHSSGCSRCNASVVSDKEARQLLVSPQSAHDDTLWLDVRRVLVDPEASQTVERYTPRPKHSPFRTLQWAAAAAVIVAAIIAAPSIVPGLKTGDTTIQNQQEQPVIMATKQVKILSSQVDGQNVECMEFNSSGSDMSMFWISKE